MKDITPEADKMLVIPFTHMCVIPVMLNVLLSMMLTEHEVVLGASHYAGA